jgi:hypothetical protein
MTHDRAVTLYAGHMGICAVLVSVLIDKGLVSERELIERFQQAREAAADCTGGTAVALALEDMLCFLEPRPHC